MLSDDLARVRAWIREGRSDDEINELLRAEPPQTWDQPEGMSEAERQQRELAEARSKLNIGATAPGEEAEPHPLDVARAMAFKQRDLGRNREAQMGAYLQSVMNAAVKGDPRVVSQSAEEAKAKRARRNEL
jgi:hypothetical protein